MARAANIGTTSVVLAMATLSLAGCYDVHTVDPGHSVVPLVADESGLVPAESNPLALGGLWYAYGDQYPTIPRCTDVGMHPADVGEHLDGQCSFVAWPDPWLFEDDGKGHFPTTDNRFCTYGNTAKVVDCEDGATQWCEGEVKQLDYGNMWGAGIGFQFDVAQGTGWDAPAHGILGVSFDFEWTDPSVKEEPFIRFEFPVVLPAEGRELLADTVDLTGKVWYAGETLPEGSTSEIHPSGSPFLGAPPVWGGSGVANDPSNAVVGHNEVLFADVKGAPSNGSTYAYLFHPESLIGLQFHVPAIKEDRIPYGFCISNLAFIRR